LPTSAAKTAETQFGSEPDFSEFDAYEITDMNHLRKRFHEMIEHS